MKQKIPSSNIRIIWKGLIAGLLAALAVRFGFGGKIQAFSLAIIEFSCETAGIANTYCYYAVSGLLLLGIVLGLWGTISDIKKAKDPLTALILYILSFVAVTFIILRLI